MELKNENMIVINDKVKTLDSNFWTKTPIEGEIFKSAVDQMRDEQIAYNKSMLENPWRMTRKEEMPVMTIKISKYFTPSIEDIRVGYECELFWNQDILPENIWDKVTIGDKGLEDIDWYRRIAEKTIRTPHLTKEQIEAEEGFELQKMDLGSDMEGFRKGNYWFILRNLPLWDGHGRTGERRLYLTIIPIDAVKSEIDIDSHLPRYFGPCPSINEFRFITRLIGI